MAHRCFSLISMRLRGSLMLLRLWFKRCLIGLEFVYRGKFLDVLWAWYMGTPNIGYIE